MAARPCRNAGIPSGHSSDAGAGMEMSTSGCQTSASPEEAAIAEPVCAGTDGSMTVASPSVTAAGASVTTAGASVTVTDGSMTVAGASVTAAGGALAGAAAAARAKTAG
jgi:hypothetical protein